MYLLKTICENKLDDYVKVINGIECCYLENKLIPISPFWGKGEISLGIFADKEKFNEKNDGIFLLPYINEYTVKNEKDNYKYFWFNVSTFQSENIEGYILFIPYTSEEIITSGKKIFGRYCNEAVIVLKDKDFLKFGDKKLEVIDNKLIMYI